MLAHRSTHTATSNPDAMLSMHALAVLHEIGVQRPDWTDNDFRDHVRHRLEHLPVVTTTLTTAADLILANQPVHARCTDGRIHLEAA